MKLEKLQKLHLWLGIISTIITIICNLRNEKRNCERYNKWLEENKVDDFKPVKKKERYPRHLGCFHCAYRTVPMSKEPCLSCVTRTKYGFKEG